MTSAIRAHAAGPRARTVRWLAAAAVALAVLPGCATTDSQGGPSPSGAGESVVGSRAEDVTIPAEGVELVGTLRLPDAQGPAPTVVIVHGSGPVNRDGMLPGQLGLTFSRPVPVYRQLAEALVEQGYAVLTWDKRTCGPFNGCADNEYPTPPEDLTVETFQADLAAVLDMLGARDDVGPVALVGHSQGGTLAAGLADRDDVAALVLLATPALPLPTVLDAQAETFADLVDAAGQTASAAEAVAEVRALADQVTEIAGGAVTGPPVGGASREFWASYVAASDAAPGQVAAADLPTFALGGEHDWNVPPDQVLAWEPYVDEVRILPGVTHALTHLGTDDVTALTPADVGEELDPAVPGAVADWLDEVLAR